MNDILYQQYLKEINQYALLTKEEENEQARVVRIRNEYKGEIPADVIAAADVAINILVTANLRLVVKIANGIVRKPSDRMDMISEGNRGLIRAAETFDPLKGAKFSVYSSFWVKQFINKFIYKASDLFKLPDKVWSNKYRVIHFIEEYELAHGVKPSNELIAKELEISVNAVSNVIDMNRQIVNLDSSSIDHDSDSCNEEIIACDDHKTPDNYCMSKEAEKVVNDLINELPARERDIIIRRYGLNGRKQDTLHEIGIDHSLTQERIRQLENNCIAKMRTSLTNLSIDDNPLGIVYI